MLCCSSTSSQPRNTLFPNKWSSKSVSPTHVAIPSPPKPQFIRLNWRGLSKSGKDPGNEWHTRKDFLLVAYHTLKRMVFNGRKPDPKKSSELMNELCRVKELRKAHSVMDLTFAATGRIPDYDDIMHLLHQYCNNGNVWYAMQIVDKMESVYGLKPNILPYNRLLQELSIQGNLSQSVKVVERVVRRGLSPNPAMFAFLVKSACAECGAQEAERLLGGIVANGWWPDLRSYYNLIVGFCYEERVDDAMRLLRSLPSKGIRPNVVLYNILLQRLFFSGQWADANELLEEMAGRGCAANSTTYNIIASSLAKEGRTKDALEVLDDMTRKGFRPTATAYNHIIAQYCRNGDVAAAKDCMETMIHRHQVAPNDATYRAVALLCDDSLGLVHEAFEIFRTLCNQHQDRPIHVFYRGLVSSLCDGGNVFATIQLLPHMARVGFIPHIHCYSSIIRGLCYKGMLDEALELMGVVEVDGFVTPLGPFSWPILHNYNALAIGFCKAQRIDLALGVYARIVERGLRPDETTYLIMVGGIVQEDELELAAKVLMELYRMGALKKTTVEKVAMERHLDDLIHWD